jgi:hypothetical protein
VPVRFSPAGPLPEEARWWGGDDPTSSCLGGWFLGYCSLGTRERMEDQGLSGHVAW